MSNEKKQLRDVCIKLLICVVCAFLYSAGGTEDMGGKWLRRYLMPIIFTGSMFYYTRSLKSLFSLALMGSLSLGYGSDVVLIKVAKRAIVGVSSGIFSGVSNLLSKKYILSLFHTVIVTVSFVYLGVCNPLNNARAEEAVLGFLIVFIPLLSSNRESV